MGQINLKSKKKRIAYKDSEFYVTSSETYSKISSDMVIEFASENSGIPKAQMASAFYALNQAVEQFLLNGHSIELMLLGCLYLSVNANAVEDEDDAGAKAVTRVSVKFRQSKMLREKINGKVQLVSTLTKKKNGSSNSQNEGNGSSHAGGNTTGDGDNPGGNTTGDGSDQ